MATSRTGTATWKRRRAYALREAQANGRTHCPYCKVELDYSTGKQPNSATVDHVIPYEVLGHDNGPLNVICKKCNESKGNREAPKPAQTRSQPFVSERW